MDNLNNSTAVWLIAVGEVVYITGGGSKMSEKNIYGIWIGENSTIAITDELRIAFLRLKKDLIISVIHHKKLGTTGVVYGHGINFEANTEAAIVNPDNKILMNNDEAKEFINKHSSDRISYDEQNKKLIYTMYDNTSFENNLAEKIEMSDFLPKNEIDNAMSVAEKMALWNIKTYFEQNDYCTRAGIDTRRYSIYLCVSLEENEFIYCRVGQNGYCEKGWAMRSTVCIRGNETRMLSDNISSINDYSPDEKCFVVGSCAFPDDGGWYWSVKEITGDVIYLNGCSGDVYEIHKK
jgi:hypothetical protein